MISLLLLLVVVVVVVVVLLLLLLLLSLAARAARGTFSGPGRVSDGPPPPSERPAPPSVSDGLYLHYIHYYNRVDFDCSCVLLLLHASIDPPIIRFAQQTLYSPAYWTSFIYIIFAYRTDYIYIIFTSV